MSAFLLKFLVIIEEIILLSSRLYVMLYNLLFNFLSINVQEYIIANQIKLPPTY